MLDYNTFGDLDTVKDIMLELQDECGLEVSYFIEKNIIHIFIKKKGGSFKLNTDIKFVLKRLCRFLGKDLYGFWRSGASREMKFYISDDDNRDVRTSGFKMDENWPYISAMRILIHYEKN